MKYLEFNEVKIPITCITGLSYSKSGNIVPLKSLSCKCTGINPLQVDLQFTLNRATCLETDFLQFARQISQIRPNKTDKPSQIVLADEVIIPQLYFMLSSVNLTYQSDRLGNLLELQVNWNLSASKVVKDENRNLELKYSENLKLIPKVVLHCKGESIECKQDINVANLRLSGFKGSIELLLADTYTSVDRDAWLTEVNNAEDTYFEIEGYGKFYILESYVIADNWLNFDLTKFSKDWYKKHTETLIAEDSEFTLANVFTNTKIKSKATFKYFKYDDTPINTLYALQDSLGFLIGIQGDDIILYDVPDIIGQGSVTYDYILDNDLMTVPITKVIMRDGLSEFTAGSDKGETLSVNANCRVTQNACSQVLKYANFNQNMITMTIPLETRISIGSIINVNVGNKIIPCVCTEYDISFLENLMTLELHYIDR